MSHTRVKIGGWGLRAKPTSAQLNQLDINVSNSLDKTTDGDDIAGPIEILNNASISFNAGSVLHLDDGSLISSDSNTVTCDLEFDGYSSFVNHGSTVVAGFEATDSALFDAAVSIADHLNVMSGAELAVKNHGDMVIENGGEFSAESGSAVKHLAGSVFDGYGTHNLRGAVNFKASSDAILENGATFAVSGDLTIESGGLLHSKSGSTATFQGSTSLQGGTSLSGITTLTDRFTAFGNDARMVKRTGDLISNANNTADVSCDVWFYTQNTDTNRVITLRRTSSPIPVAGEMLRFNIFLSSGVSTSTSVKLINETSGTELCSFSKSTGAELHGFVTCVFHGGSWRILSASVDSYHGLNLLGSA